LGWLITRVICQILAGDEPSAAGGRTYCTPKVARAEYSLLFSLWPANPPSLPL